MPEFLGYKIEEWFPASPQVGPPLPRWMNIPWFWVKVEAPPKAPPEAPPEEAPPIPQLYACPYCGITFATYNELTSHLLTQHGVVGPPPEEIPPPEIIPPKPPEAPPQPQFSVPETMETLLTDGTILDQYWNCHAECLISNKGGAAGHFRAHVFDNVGVKDFNIEGDIPAGGSYRFVFDQWVDFRRLSEYIVQLVGEWPTNRVAVAAFHL